MSGERRLVAALACRVNGARLYGKPLQNLDIENNYTILDHIIAGAKASGLIDEIVLGISEGVENQIFMDVAKRHGVSYIIGSEQDVLMRLIQCGRAGRATDIFRVTTECPFIAWEFLEQAWKEHVEKGCDITVTDYMSEGLNFEIYTQESIERCHARGRDGERSEFCSAYARRNHHEFKINIIEPPVALQRMDYRLTVDYPEDLIVCRKVYSALKASGAQIPVADILTYLDHNRHIHDMIDCFVDQTPIWANVIKAKV